MSLLRKRTEWVSPEEYLARESRGEVRHEYLAGKVIAMAGGTITHALIVGDIMARLHRHLRGHRCLVFVNDVQARIQTETADWFYYPDVMVSCDPTGLHKTYCTTPAVIFEVLSPDTARIDQQEKLLAYRLIPSLHTYVLVSQEEREVSVYRKAQDGRWSEEVLAEPGDSLRLPQLDFAMSLEEMYERSGV